MVGKTAVGSKWRSGVGLALIRVQVKVSPEEIKNKVDLRNSSEASGAGGQIGSAPQRQSGPPVLCYPPRGVCHRHSSSPEDPTAHIAASLTARAQTSRMVNEAAEEMGDVSRSCAPWALLECEDFNSGRMRTCWPGAWCSVKRAELLFLPHR